MVSTHFQNKMSRTAECNKLVWEAGRSNKGTVKRDFLKVHSLFFSGSVALPRIVKNEEDTDVIRKNNGAQVYKGSLGPKYGRI